MPPWGRRERASYFSQFAPGPPGPCIFQRAFFSGGRERSDAFDLRVAAGGTPLRRFGLYERDARRAPAFGNGEGRSEGAKANFLRGGQDFRGELGGGEGISFDDVDGKFLLL